MTAKSGAAFNPDNDIPNLSGQVVIVTGGNAGLGLETIRQLLKHNPSSVYLAARSKEKAEAAIQDLNATVATTASRLSFLELDLSSFASIKAAAQTFTALESRLDILVNNAGLTKEGYEIQFGTNHLGHALLTSLLLPTLFATAPLNPQTRVVNVSSASEALAPSDVYKFDEFQTTMANRSTRGRYTISKLANIHYNSALARTHDDRGVKFVCVHPGMVATNLHHNADGWIFRKLLDMAIGFATPVEKGAYSQLWAAVSPGAQNGGAYAPVGQVWKRSKRSKDRELEEKLWKWTQEQLKAHLE